MINKQLEEDLDLAKYDVEEIDEFQEKEIDEFQENIIIVNGKIKAL